MPIESYQDLTVWQKAMEMVERCYQLTRAFPSQEMYGMISQIRRAAVSIPANIAEGWGREGTQEFVQFLRIAQGSVKELETLLLLSLRVQLVKAPEINPILEMLSEVSRMLHSLIGSLRRKLK